ncbi:MAG: sulfurtransferase TusA family protein [Spirochaetia bacterium]|nr:sulfurtransferase TusA family protein [Spirochaetia bacterium]
MAIQAKSVETINGELVIDVSGQTCPGYLLAINKALTGIEKGTPICVVSSYPPCGEDVKSYCDQKGFKYRSTGIEDKMWKIRFEK